LDKVMMADLMRWNPFDQLQRFTEKFSSVDDGYRVRIPLPGISPENVTVDVTGRTIHVRGIERDGDKEMIRYEEVLTLPASVDADTVGATFRHGLLELTLPYQNAVKPRRIEITTEVPKQLSTAA
jgi:HSP20 family protein